MSKITLKTSDLQVMLNKAMKGVSDNKMILLTSLIGIMLEDNKLSITATDATNFIQVIKDKVEGEEFAVTVRADVFNKLVQKTSVPEITLELTDDYLEFKGNGTYKLDLPLDENSDPICYPDVPEVNGKKGKIQYTSISSIINANKPALAVTMEMPCITGYYCGQQVLTTDSFKVAFSDIKLFEGKPILLASEAFELLTTMNDENIEVNREGSKVLFKSRNAEKKMEVIVYTVELEGIGDFPAEILLAQLEEEFESSCRLSKSGLLEVIDRLSLFVNEYDKKGIYLTFTKKGLMFQSKSSNGSETVAYKADAEDKRGGSTNFKPFTCCVDITMLKDLVNAQTVNTIDLHYGSEVGIKFANGKINHVLAFLEDDRVGTSNE